MTEPTAAPNTPTMSEGEHIELLPLHLVYANPNQPRTIFAAGALEELANSIREKGLMQPITVVPRKTAQGEYLIVAGERRWRASKLAQLTAIKAIVRADLNDRDVAELALIENLLRQDLSILEEARAYQSFLERGYTVESLAKLLGFNQSWRVTERTNLLKLDARLQDGLSKGAISPSQAQEMSKHSTEGQFRLWRAIQDGKCESYAKLCRISGAIQDQENQQQLFQNAEQLSETEKKSIDAVDQFMTAAGRLLQMLDDEDLAILERVAKSNAQACADQLALIENLCRKAKNALLTNVAKQQVMAA